ncbi:AbrB/MazE/SpoVT family DNA-binding domain-containing protein [Patescibacteria group bacterium]|nr:AbrB/MazE/SpoVT family DNA-binding domain-containing protein [Patescibacteria group bacterium]
MAKNKEIHCIADACISTTVMGERGQVVIPKEVRDDFDLRAGDKFLVMSHHGQAIGLIPINQAKKQFAALSKKIESVIGDISE